MRAVGAPRLLLDANVFRDLAEGSLRQFEERLLRIAECREPPLLWTCPIASDEVLCHVRVEEADEFDHFREALRWMDRLCGNLGMAEDLLWIRRRPVFVEAAPYENSELSIALNQIRRRILRAETFGHLDSDVRESIEERRKQYAAEIARWTERRARLVAGVQEPPPPGTSKIEGYPMVANAIFEVSRKFEKKHAPGWGQFSEPEDQKHAQREVIAFELALLLKAKDHSDYKIEKHQNDYNDGWLCAYPGAGYTLVTGDRKLMKALQRGECKNPRVLEVGAALDLAEKWLVEGSSG
jgi:hypothetical protein